MSVWTASFLWSVFQFFFLQVLHSQTQSIRRQINRVSVLRECLILRKRKGFFSPRTKQTVCNNEVSVKRGLLILNHFFEGWSLDNLHEEWCNQPLGWRADIYWQSFGGIAS